MIQTLFALLAHEIVPYLLADLVDSKVSTCYWLNKDWVRLGFGAEFLFGRRCVDVDESGGGTKYDEGMQWNSAGGFGSSAMRGVPRAGRNSAGERRRL